MGSQVQFTAREGKSSVMSRWWFLPLLLGTIRALEEVSSPAYLALSAQEKADRLWKNCLDDSTSAPWFSSLDQGLKLIAEPMCPVFRTGGDELPEEGDGRTRAKVIHTVGVVGRVEWRDAGGHNFSGIFKGAQHGLVRLSLALKPDNEILNTAPGMGLKFLRDGMDSANLVAMYSVDGQESWNFFKNDFSNHIPDISFAKKASLGVKFATATRNIRQVGISDWGKYGESGAETTNLSFPYRLRFHPTGNLSFPDTYVRPVNEDLVTIPSGSVLYQVFALDAPEQLGGMEKRIGDLVLTSGLVTSKWGDEHLFIRHQDMAEDLQLRQEWNQYTPQMSLFLKDPNRPSPCGE